MNNIINNEYIMKYDIYDLDSTLEVGQIMVLNKYINTDEELFQKILKNIIHKNPYEIWCLSELCFNNIDYKSKRLLTKSEYLDLLNYRYNKKPNKIIGITGSYGKTSVSFFLNSILRQWNYKSCVSCSMGTMNHNDNQFQYGGLSTLGTASLYRFLNYNSECNVGIIEVSSIAAKQNRTAGIKFDGGIFTAFSIDHLDMHESLDDYWTSKCQFMNKINGPRVKLNTIDQYDSNDIFPSNDYYIKSDLEFYINEKTIKIAQKINNYQQQNLLGCLTLLDKMQLIPNNYNDIILNITEPRGRMEYVGKTKYNSKVYIDGAHAADQVNHMLQSLNITDKNDYVIVYGAAGNRLKTDVKTADYLIDFPNVIITDDCPMNMDSEYILNQLRRDHFHVIANRFEAIKYALNFHDKIIIILGKASETSNKIIYKNCTVYYNEFKVVSQLIEQLNSDHNN